MQKNAMRGGAYSVVITAVVLAILVAVNVFFSALPASSTEYDISASKLYSVASNTRSVVSALTEDVTIYWIVQAGEEDAVIEKLLDRYESLSDHITVEKRNPDVYPTFAEQYTDGTVYNNSLVVECGDRSRYISNTDIYLTDASLYSYSYSTSFDGEGAIGGLRQPDGKARRIRQPSDQRQSRLVNMGDDHSAAAGGGPFAAEPELEPAACQADISRLPAGLGLRRVKNAAGRGAAVIPR